MISKSRFTVFTRVFAVFSSLLLAMGAAAQTNIIYGYVGDYSTNAQRRVNVTVTLLEPNPRTTGVWDVRRDSISTFTSTSGYYSFTNLLWGKYRRDVQGVSGTSYIFYVGTNTLGLVPITSLTTNNHALPPDPGTNYYTQAQTDARIAGAVPEGVLTNTQTGVTLAGRFTATNVPVLWDGESEATATNYGFTQFAVAYTGSPSEANDGKAGTYRWVASSWDSRPAFAAPHGLLAGTTNYIYRGETLFYWRVSGSVVSSGATLEAAVTNLNPFYITNKTGYPLEADARGLVNVEGTSIINDTVNSNKFDAATRAMLGGGGVSLAQLNAVSNHFPAVFNVMDFGAVGNGVTSDTIAFQAAIDASRSTYGQVPVYVPVDGAKEYLITNTLYATNMRGLSIIGGVGDQTALDPEGATITFTGTNHFLVTDCYLTMRGLRIHGPGKTVSKGAGWFAKGSYGEPPPAPGVPAGVNELLNVSLHGFLYGHLSTNMDNTRFQKVHMVSCETGFKFTGTVLNSISIHGCTTGGAGGSVGIDVEGGAQLHVDSTDVGATNSGIIVRSGANVVWQNNNIEQTGEAYGTTGGHAIQAIGSSAAIYIIGGRVIGNGGYSLVQSNGCSVHLITPSGFNMGIGGVSILSSDQFMNIWQHGPSFYNPAITNTYYGKVIRAMPWHQDMAGSWGASSTWTNEDKGRMWYANSWNANDSDWLYLIVKHNAGYEKFDLLRYEKDVRNGSIPQSGISGLATTLGPLTNSTLIKAGLMASNTSKTTLISSNTITQGGDPTDYAKLGGVLLTNNLVDVQGMKLSRNNLTGDAGNSMNLISAANQILFLQSGYGEIRTYPNGATGPMSIALGRNTTVDTYWFVANGTGQYLADASAGDSGLTLSGSAAFKMGWNAGNFTYGFTPSLFTARTNASFAGNVNLNGFALTNVGTIFSANTTNSGWLAIAGRQTNHSGVTITSGQLLLATGSAAAPNIARLADPDDGIEIGENISFYRDGKLAGNISVSGGIGQLKLAMGDSASPLTQDIQSRTDGWLILGATTTTTNVLIPTNAVVGGSLLATNGFETDGMTLRGNNLTGKAASDFTLSAASTLRLKSAEIIRAQPASTGPVGISLSRNGSSDDVFWFCANGNGQYLSDATTGSIGWNIAGSQDFLIGWGGGVSKYRWTPSLFTAQTNVTIGGSLNMSGQVVTNVGSILVTGTNATAKIQNWIGMGMQWFTDGTNIIVVLQNASGGRTTNKITGMSQWPPP